MGFAADIGKAVASGRLTSPFSARRLAFALFFLSAAFLARPCSATPGEWDLIGSLNAARDIHTATWNLSSADGFTFTPGHFYSASDGVGSQDIYEYDETGAFLSSMTPQSLIPGDELRGIVFGPDGFLYAVRIHFAELGFQILALDSSGRTQAAYTKGDIGLGGDSGYGKIAFDQQYIYVAGGGVVVRFTFGDPNSGTSIYSNNGIIDVKPLPNGDLFVVWAYGVDEITNEGAIVRSIPLIGADWANVQGIEYDPAVNKLFATELGYSGFDSPLMRIDASTGVLENWVYFNYGNDLFLTPSNTLLVGSYTQAPGIFDENLISIGSLGTEARVFVTEYTAGVPTPTPTATATFTPTPTATATATATPTATATATATASTTPTATATPTARPTPTPRFAPTPRPRPTPAPRP